MNAQNYPIILQTLGHWFLFSIMAVAFYIALRRTSLLGFRLLFYFAAGQLFLSIVGGMMVILIAKFFTITTFHDACRVHSLLGYALYILPLAGLALLMCDKQRRNA